MAALAQFRVQRRQIAIVESEICGHLGIEFHLRETREDDVAIRFRAHGDNIVGHQAVAPAVEGRRDG